jgi:lysophospholipase L1-like esterase
MRTCCVIAVAVLAASDTHVVRARGEQAGALVEPPVVGGIQVYLKMDFDESDTSFQPAGNGAVSTESQPALVASGRSLHVSRAQPGSYFGALTKQVRADGTRGLKIAFVVKARGLQTVSVNLFDELHSDNTTPTSPARVTDDGGWRTVVFAVEDFHFNADPPERKAPSDTRHTSLMFYGQEQSGGAGQFWIDKLIVYRGDDVQPPEAPRDLEADVAADGGIGLTWREPADNAFPAVYAVYRKSEGGAWEKIADAIQPRFVDRPPAAGTYTYRVTAADFDNLLSAASSDVSVSINTAGTAASPVLEDRIADRRNYAERVRQIHAAGQGRVRHDLFLFAGDSITAANMYSDILIAWLGRGIAVRQGVGQIGTEYGKAHIAEYLAQSRPEFAIVMYGTNDSKDSRSIDRAMANLSAVIDACAEFGTVPVLSTIPPRGYSKRGQGEQVRFNQALVRLCRTKKVPVSYCFEEMMQRDLEAMLYDGVHLSPNPGNDAAGEALWKTFQQIGFALQDGSNEWK